MGKQEGARCLIRVYTGATLRCLTIPTRAKSCSASRWEGRQVSSGGLGRIAKSLQLAPATQTLRSGHHALNDCHHACVTITLIDRPAPGRRSYDERVPSFSRELVHKPDRLFFPRPGRPGVECARAVHGDFHLYSERPRFRPPERVQHLLRAVLELQNRRVAFLGESQRPNGRRQGGQSG